MAGDIDKDFTLVADGRKIRSYRACLEEHSEYFRALCSSGMVESRRNHISFENMKFETLQLIVNYCEDRFCGVAENNFQCLLFASDMLQMSGLKERVLAYMEKELCVQKAVNFFQISQLYNCPEFSLKCCKLIALKFDEFSRESGVEASYFDIMKYLLSREFFNSDENLICKFILKLSVYITSEQLCELMELIYLDHVTIENDVLKLYRNLEYRKGFRKDCQTLAFVDSIGQLWHWKRNERCLEKATSLPKRTTGYSLIKYDDKLLMFGGEERIGFGDWNMNVYQWDSVRNTWDVAATMDTQRRCCTSVRAGNKIYLFHGYGRYRVDMGSSVSVFNVEERHWENVKFSFRHTPSLPYNSLLFHNGFFYNFVSTQTIYVFDEASVESEGSGSVVEIDDLPLLSITYAFSMQEWILCLTSCGRRRGVPAFLWNPTTQEGFTLSGKLDICDRCVLIDKTLFNIDFIDNAIQELVVDVESRTVRDIGWFPITPEGTFGPGSVSVIPYF